MNRVIWNAWPFVLLLCIAVGCNSSEFKSLRGKVVLPGEIDFQFAEDVIELRSKSNPQQFAFGEIQSDGSFEVQSLEKGEIVNGARPGAYEARLVIADDDYSHKKFASQLINKRYLQFESSGLSIDIPGDGVVLQLVR